MVVTKTLEGISNETLCKVFNEAFSDYQITVQEPVELFVARNTRNGFCPSSSMGLFDNDQLVGFILICIRDNCAYDGATGIIPSYRGKGYSHLLVDETIKHLKQEGRSSFILEVLNENEKAKQLYIKHGFSYLRTLNCYTINRSELRDEIEVELLGSTGKQDYQEECIPSWQNSKASIEASGLTIYDMVQEGKRRGSICFEAQSGTVALLYIEPKERRKGFAKQAITEAAKHCTAENIRLINIDEAYKPLNELLRNMGFKKFITQSEMVLQL